MNTLSCGLLDFTKLMAAEFTACRFSRMEPELSITMPMATGISSRRNEVIFCAWLSSKTAKSARLRSVTRWFLSSTTVACNVTSSTSLWKTYKSPFFSAGFCPCSPGEADPEEFCGVPAGGFCAIASVARKIMRPRVKNSILFRGCIVSRFGVNMQGRKPFRRIQFHFDFPPFAITYGIAGAVSKHVLIAQLDPDLGRHVGKLIGISDGKGSSSRHLRYLTQELWPFSFFRRLEVAIVQTNGINLHIGLPHQRLDLAFRVATMIIAAIRDNEQSLFLVIGLAHAVHSQINSIQQGRTPPGLGIDQPALDVLNRAGEVGQ